MGKLRERYPLYLANRAVQANADLPVTDKHSGEIVTRVALADASVVNDAIAAAVRAKKSMRALHAYERKAALQHCVKRFEARAEELAMALCIEAGKPIRDARVEVTRLIDTFSIAAEEAVRIVGEVLPMDISPRAKDYRAQWTRVPVGVVSCITPFNFPLNLVAHKVAPAIACGCPFVLKPASTTPIGALIIGEVLAETALPEGAFSILPATAEAAPLFATDERLSLLSFTGSPRVGWELKAKAGKKQVVLELGGNAAVIVDADADLDDAVQRIVTGAFYQSGQSCISVQRIFVQRAVYDTFRDKLVAATRKLRAGDPKDEQTFVGPLISEKDAARLLGWIDEARSQGARVLCGGTRLAPALLEPTLLENVPRSSPLCAVEAFGPVAVLEPFDDFRAALDAVNDTEYGLQAGVFTRDLYKALAAWDELEVGSVIVGDVPSFRVDHMPYGGVKSSGLGREGVRFAIE
ncbi:MAG TPA: aldehyde dehydrogenase family protein, partial [Polyangiales bacterium]|nr:aldehyde dehydrogenase family protein [Polyangiales bacterium]